MIEPERYTFDTLPDYLTPGLRLVFVGINPAVYAVQRGHYFARGTNRFWPAFSRSRLSLPVRVGLARETLKPENDADLLAFGIGFTDVVKLPSPKVSDLRPSDYREWTPRLLRRLEAYKPLVACFHGVTGYREFARHVLGDPPFAQYHLGPQPHTLGSTHLFLAPNPSGANAHFTPADQVAWYDRLADYLTQIAE